MQFIGLPIDMRPVIKLLGEQLRLDPDRGAVGKGVLRDEQDFGRRLRAGVRAELGLRRRDIIGLLRHILRALYAEERHDGASR